MSGDGSITWDDLPCQALLETETERDAQRHIDGCSTCREANTVLELNPDGTAKAVTVNIVEKL